MDETDPHYYDPAKNEFWKRFVVIPTFERVMNNLVISKDSRETLCEDYVASRDVSVDNPDASVQSCWAPYIARFETYTSQWHFYNKVMNWDAEPEKRAA